MVRETDLELRDARTLHAYDTGDDGRLAVFWHHGTPNIGTPPEPLFAAADRLGIRWVSYDRPGYGGSTPHRGRDVASAAADVSSAADALGIDRFAVMSHSGGGPHALARAALLPDRVRADATNPLVCRGFRSSSVASNLPPPRSSTSSTTLHLLPSS